MFPFWIMDHPWINLMTREPNQMWNSELVEVNLSVQFLLNRKSMEDGLFPICGYFPMQILISLTWDFDTTVLEQITEVKIQSDLRSCEDKLWCLLPAQLYVTSKDEIKTLVHEL